MNTINRNFKIALVSIITAILAMCVALGITLISIRVGIKLFQNSVMVSAVTESCILISQFFVIKKYNNGIFSLKFIDMNLKRNSFKHFLIGIGLGILVYFTYVLILSKMRIIKFKGIGFMFYPTNKVILAVISAFVISVLAGFIEEILFRGVILKNLMKFKGKIFAIIISSLIFPVFHGNYYHQPFSLFAVFIMAIILGYLYIITGSLYLSIGLHFMTDFSLLITGNSNNFLIIDTRIKNSDLMLYFSYVQIFVILILILSLVLYRYKNRKMSTGIEI